MDSYDSDIKRQYRVKISTRVDYACRRPRALRTVVYLDTKEALETKHLLALGYAPENLLAVNRNAAEVATLQRRLDEAGLPRVHTSGKEFHRAVLRDVPQVFGTPHVDVMHFDGTGCFRFDVYLGDLRAACQASTPLVVALNMLAGREQPSAFHCINNLAKTGQPVYRTTWGKEVRATHVARIWGALSALTYVTREEQCWAHPRDVAWDTYLSQSGQTMAWAVARFIPHHKIDGKELKAILTGKQYKVGLPPWCMMWEMERMRNAIAARAGRFQPENQT